MASMREIELMRIYDEMRKRPMVSLSQIDQLMDQVNKVLMEIKRVTDSREKWQKKYWDLKKEKKEALKDGS